MENMQVKIVNRLEDLPQMTCRNFFHSIELFKIFEQTSGHTPYMVMVKNENDQVVAHLLATIRRRGTFAFPFYTQGRIYGEGEYVSETNKEQLFELMLVAITKKFVRKLCLYIEFSNLGSKMFGYKFFRKHEYFPVRWMQISNSLHSKAPIERISEKMIQRIKNAYAKNGVETVLAKTEKEIDDFYTMLRNYYRFKPQRFIPKKQFFQQINASPNGEIHITKYKNKIIGGSAIVYSKGDAFLWYIASKKKLHAAVHPNLLTIWNALQSSYIKGYRHLHFMNVGLPFRKNIYRENILKFGGKPASSYRWFHTSIGWINKLLRWIYRE